MGLLADSKTRRKISSDPNNTKWSKDETTFGQRMLRAQGWQPGQFLGAQDAAHAELHTAANASYIRVALKDDMKGLGFNRAKEDEVTGLDVFSDVLSRLNGKSEEDVENGRQQRLVVKANHYVDRRWGPMRFVRGGFLVGDKVQGIEEEAEDETTEAADTSSKSKKRKAASVDDEETSAQEETRSKKQRKEDRKKKKKALAAAEDSEDESSLDKAERRARRKLKKEKRERSKTESDTTPALDEKEGNVEVESAKSTKKRRSKKTEEESDNDSDDKLSKKDKKKKDKKDKKKRKTKAKEGSDSESTPATKPAVSTPGQSTPVISSGGTSTPQGSRNFVRSRFIAQKRQAVLDTKALNQIFMVKA